MRKEISITCPGCNTILIVDRNSGDIIETRKPLVEHSSGDRINDALDRLKQEKEKSAALFDNMAEDLNNRRKSAESLFDSSLKDVKKKDVKRPDNIFDLD